MNRLIELRQEIAKERLVDLSKQYGMKSPIVNSYKRRMKDVLDSKVDVSSLALNEEPNP